MFVFLCQIRKNFILYLADVNDNAPVFQNAPYMWPLNEVGCPDQY